MIPFTTLTNDIVDTSPESVLIDYAGEGEVLVITFGFYDFAGNHRFDFYGRLKKLEQLSGRKISKILLKDRANSWYQSGIAGLGDTVDECVAALRQLISTLKPRKVITLGQSMGAYGALVYGLLLGADKAIACGSLSTINPEVLELIRDHRWLPPLRATTRYYDDIPTLIAQQGGKTAVELFFGTYPEGSAQRMECVNYDALHAMRSYGLPNVTLFPAHQSAHVIVEYWKRYRVVDTVLLNRILGLPVVDVPYSGVVAADWYQWIATNIELGSLDADLVLAMMKNAIPEETAEYALQEVHARQFVRLLGSS